MADEPAPTASEHAQVFIPPPLVYVLGFVAGIVLQRQWPIPPPALEVGSDVGLGCFAFGVVTTLAGMLTFARARTSIVPIRQSRVLVQSGPYRFTRNPMYLGFALLYASVGLLSRQPWALIMLAPVALIIDRFAIVPEERYLEVRFGDEYRSYRTKVRRWI